MDYGKAVRLKQYSGLCAKIKLPAVFKQCYWKQTGFIYPKFPLPPQTLICISSWLHFHLHYMGGLDEAKPAVWEACFSFLFLEYDMVVLLMSVWEWNPTWSLIRAMHESLWIRLSCDRNSAMMEWACPQSYSAASQCPRPLHPHSHTLHTQPHAGDTTHSRFLLPKGPCVFCSCRPLLYPFVIAAVSLSVFGKGAKDLKIENVKKKKGG